MNAEGNVGGPRYHLFCAVRDRTSSIRLARFFLFLVRSGLDEGTRSLEIVAGSWESREFRDSTRRYRVAGIKSMIHGGHASKLYAKPVPGIPFAKPTTVQLRIPIAMRRCCGVGEFWRSQMNRALKYRDKRRTRLAMQKQVNEVISLRTRGPTGMRFLI